MLKTVALLPYPPRSHYFVLLSLAAVHIFSAVAGGHCRQHIIAKYFLKTFM